MVNFDYKKAVLMYFKSNHYLDVFLVGLRKITKISIRVSGFWLVFKPGTSTI